MKTKAAPTQTVDSTLYQIERFVNQRKYVAEHFYSGSTATQLLTTLNRVQQTIDYFKPSTTRGLKKLVDVILPDLYRCAPSEKSRFRRSYDRLMKKLTNLQTPIE